MQEDIGLWVVFIVGFLLWRYAGRGAEAFRRAGEDYARRQKRKRIVQMLDQVQAGNARGMAKAIKACDGDAADIAWVARTVSERGLLARAGGE